MPETLFLQFTETNDHEGETWHYWLQIDGNELNIDQFRELVDALDDEQYELTVNIEPESVVDKLVQFADSGYGRTHSKVTGVFTCPDDLGEYGDSLYKGGVSKFFAAVSA